MNDPNLSGAPVYVRYKDHVLYRNLVDSVEEAAERETIGWLTKQDSEIMLIEHDRNIPDAQIPNGSGSGLVLLKSCIIEIRTLPLQRSSDGHLNSQETKDKAEYALQPTKRKTPKRNGTGAKQ